jgi:SEC-C motif domain protein
VKRSVAPPPCPCGSGKEYAACCGSLHAGAPAVDAEALMRSRYSAYALGLANYLRATWHPSTRPAELDLAGGPRWLGLTVLRHEQTGEDRAIVEFVARYKAGGRAGKLAEVSRFLREDGRWYYVDGDVG